MSRFIIVPLAAILLVVLILAIVIDCDLSGIDQPIAFSHRLHTEEVGVECIECHHYFMEYTVSGLPDEEVCMVCHEEVMTDSPEEKKLVDILASGDELLFQKLFHLPDHVYYSHRLHVAVAEIECAKCHGEIAMTDFPPDRPLVKMDMDYCMDCHDELGVTNDCITCHK
jgi:formylmethanofuran dehydrogenase subunit E